MSLRIVYMGTPDFAVPALAALLEAGHTVVAVYSQPPRPAGRGHKVQLSPVHAFAEARGLPVFTPKSLRKAEEQAVFAAHQADVAVVAAYGLILPKAILEAPRLGCVNIHGSLLPRWRGAAPIQRSLLAGDAATGIAIMQMDEGLDTGAVLSMEETPIGPADTASTLHDRLAAMGARMVVEAVAGLEAGSLIARPQPEEGVTYAAKLSRDDGRLDWTQTAAHIDRQVRALTPWPGCWFDMPADLGGERIKVLAAGLVSGSGPSAPGVVLDGELTVACGEGALRLTSVQRPGKAAVSGGDFLRGQRLSPGVSLA